MSLRCWCGLLAYFFFRSVPFSFMALNISTSIIRLMAWVLVG
jgi:hypothetical protein